MSVAEIAARRGATNAQVLLRWALQRGVRVIPGATSAVHIGENMNLSCFTLTAEDDARLTTTPKPPKFAKYAI